MNRRDLGNRSATRRGRTVGTPVFLISSIIILSAVVLVITARRPSGQGFILTTGNSGEIATTDCIPHTTTTLKLIPVHIDGAVDKPGVYFVPEETLLFELVRTAGGFTRDAEQSGFNLAMLLTAHMKIYVPSKGEALNQNPVQRQEDTRTADKIIDLNRATREDLESLPGVGPATAEAIVSFRDANGPFKSVEDLMRIPGIKEGKFARLKDRLVITSP